MSRVFDLQNISDISVVGLPLAFSIAVVFQFVLLLIFLYRKIGDFRIKEISYSFGKILIATVFGAIVVFLTLRFVADLVNMRTFRGVFTQGVSAGIIGVLIYLFLSLVLKSPELRIIKSSIIKQFTKG